MYLRSWGGKLADRHDTRVPMLSTSQPLRRGRDFSPGGPHAHSDSDTDQLNLPQMQHAASWTENLTGDLTYLLPACLVEEISDTTEPQPLSQADFEEKLAAGDTAGAKRIVVELAAAQKEPKEKGRLVRSAAESAKRFSSVMLAIELFELGTTVDPSAPASWIDRAKLLDELGDYARSEAVLQEGIKHVQPADQLIRKLLKSFERTGSVDTARAFLGETVRSGATDTECVLVEGALFEMRQGRVAEAMELLAYVKEKKGWKTNVYSELVQYFDRSGKLDAITDLIEEGVRVNPRNALMCQALLKSQHDADAMIRKLNSSRDRWTPEFTDKMTTTVCETLAMRGCMNIVRNLMADAIVYCSSRQRYKLLVTAAIIELVHSDVSLTPLILDFAVQVTPSKSRPSVLILLAKVCELNGEFERALTTYERVAREYAAEWRVFFELAQFHVHRSDIPSAITVLSQALQQHPGSGRLWAFRVQLEAFISLTSQVEVLREAINAVPKSGEVWCEAARIALNPLSEYFNLESAQQYLEFAYRFTPQHGDSLVELVRARMLKDGPNADMRDIEQRFICSEGNYGMLYVFVRQMDDRPASEVFRDAVTAVWKDIQEHRKAYSRAIARSSFVVQSVQKEAQRFQAIRSTGDPASFAFGLTSATRLILNPTESETEQQRLSIIMGTLRLQLMVTG